jgi:hypothetical protein
MTEGRQPFTAEIKMLAKGPSTYDPLENAIQRKAVDGATVGLRQERSSRFRFSARNATL